MRLGLFLRQLVKGLKWLAARTRAGPRIEAAAPRELVESAIEAALTPLSRIAARSPAALPLQRFLLAINSAMQTLADHLGTVTLFRESAASLMLAAAAPSLSEMAWPAPEFATESGRAEGSSLRFSQCRLARLPLTASRSRSAAGRLELPEIPFAAAIPLPIVLPA